MYDKSTTLAQYDAELLAAIQGEERRQEDHIELIASENYASPAVMEAQGSLLTNKYAEGYPGKRYYGGCEFVDVAEELAIARVKQLFDCDYANVQPHSGAQANAAIFLALVAPGETVMGMNLAQGGHLTHGNPANFSGKHYKIVPYGLDTETGVINYDEMERIALETRPKLIIGGFSAYSRYKDWARMRAIADKVGAYFWVDMAHVAGLVAAGEYPSPLPHAHVVTSTTHKTLRGPRGGIILAKGQGEDFYKKLNSAVFPGIQGGPLMHAIAAKAVAFREAHTAPFRRYAAQVVTNARALTASLAEAGIRTVSGGTDTHLALLDLQELGVDGRTAEARCAAAAITLNKNAIPFDPAPPAVASGIRVGSAAVTTQGFDAADMGAVGTLVARAVRADLDTSSGAAELAALREEVATLVARKPAYPRA